MRKLFVSLMAASLMGYALSLSASLVEVKDAYSVTVTNTADGVTAVSEQQAAGYPECLPTPIFWFDCTQTNGWQIERGVEMPVPEDVMRSMTDFTLRPEPLLRWRDAMADQLEASSR